MSDLEPIDFNNNVFKKKIIKQIDQSKEIKELIFNETGIDVSIQKIKLPLIILVVNSASAASELYLQKTKIVKLLNSKHISEFRILIK